MAGADYGRLARIYGLSKVDLDLPPASDILITAKGPGRIVTVLYIAFFPSAWASATLTFYDSVTSKTIGALSIPATPPQNAEGSQFLYLDYGPDGTPLTAGASLMLTGSAAGRLHIDAYQKGRPTATSTALVTGFASLG